MLLCKGLSSISNTIDILAIYSPTVGTSKGRVPPEGLSISTNFTASGKEFPELMQSHN